jgi:hypothetical protein
VQGFRIVPPISLRILSKEAKPPFSEPQPISSFVVGSGPARALLRLRRVAQEFVVSVHR